LVKSRANVLILALQTAPNLITARLLQVEIEARKVKNLSSLKDLTSLNTKIAQLFADGYLELPELMYSEQPKTIGLDSTYTPFAQENIREGTPTSKGTVLTLSNGRYDEFKNAKIIETIGSVRFNTEKNKIVGFGENKRSVEVVSRFLSVDPIAAQYPELTPYQFASNTPIQAIDLDGLERGDPPYKRNNLFMVQLFTPWVAPVIRKDGKKFTQTAIELNSADRIDYTINAQKYARTTIFVNPLMPGDNSSFVAEGITVHNGSVVSGKSSPGTFNCAIKNGKVSFGAGAPSVTSDFAVGGGVPLMINGLKYGENNIYSDKAPKDLPIVGDPGEANRKFLLQRSSEQDTQDKINQLWENLFLHIIVKQMRFY
jgi:hypothetical protein